MKEAFCSETFIANKAQQDGRLRRAQLKMLGMLKIIDAICLKHKLDYWLEGGTLLGAVRHQGFIPWDDDLDIAMPRESYEAFLRIAPTELPNSMLIQTAETEPGYFNLSVPMKIRDRNSLFIELHEQGNEPYHQGIFIDVFVYDRLSAQPFQRQYDKFLAKKIMRLLGPKSSPVTSGHYAQFYRLLGRVVPKKLLEKKLKKIISRANKKTSPYLGYGYDCVNSNLTTYQDIYPLQRSLFEGTEFNIVNNAEVILTQLYGNYMALPPMEERIMKHCKELIL